MKKRLQHFGVTPLYARKMQFVQDMESTSSAVVGTLQPPLVSQPAMKLLDMYDNPVVTDRICAAVTASFTPDSAMEIYGQSLNDTNSYCRREQDPSTETFESFCLITANAVHATASFTALSIPGGARDGLQLLFTAGCCDPEPLNCYCADPETPLQRDRSLPSTSSVTEPCVRANSAIFSIIQNLATVDASLAFSDAPKGSYTAGETIIVRLFLENNGERLGGTLFTAAAILYDEDSKDPSSAILEEGVLGAQGVEVVVASESGMASFDNLRVTNLQGLSRFRLVFYLKDKPSTKVTSEVFEITPAIVSEISVQNVALELSTTDAFTARLLLSDRFGNPAQTEGTARIVIHELERAKGASMGDPIRGTISVPFNGFEASFTLHWIFLSAL